MGLWLKQSTAISVKIGPFIDDTDGKTAEVALTLSQADIRLSKNGANIAQKNEANNATTDELGYYDCPLDATDTGTLGVLQLFVHEAGALPVFHEYMVVPANVWDSFFGADKLDVNTAELANIDFGATMKASINTEVDNALNTAIPVDPTADSVNERVKAIDDKLPTNYIMGSSVVTDKDDEINAIKAKTDNLPVDPADESLLETEINANETKIDTLQTDITAIKGYIDTEVAAILADTNELQTDWVNGGRLDLLLDAVKAKTDTIPVNPATEAKQDTIAGYIDTEIAAIKAVTDTLTLAAIADAVHDETTEVGMTLREAINIILAALAGKSTGGGTNTIKFKDQADTKFRITATVTADGDRIAIANDGT